MAASALIPAVAVAVAVTDAEVHEFANHPQAQAQEVEDKENNVVHHPHPTKNPQDDKDKDNQDVPVPVPVPDVPAMVHMIGGFAAGVVGTVLGYPLDTIKSRLQVQQHVQTHHPQTNNMKSALGMVGMARHIVRKEGIGLSGLYRGVGPPLLSLTLLNTLNFSLYHAFLDYYSSYYHSSATTTNDTTATTTAFAVPAVCAGASVGPFAALISTVENVVKTQLQLQPQHYSISSSQHAHNYNNNDHNNNHRAIRSSATLQCVRQLWKGAGGGGNGNLLYLGHGVNTLREMVFLGTYFGVYEELRRSSTCSSRWNNTLPVPVPVAGGLAGALAWIITFPLDCIRARVQGQALFVDHHGNGNNDHHNIMKCKRTLQNARHVAMELLFHNQQGGGGGGGGLRSLYAGVTPSIVRAFLVSGSRFTAYESVVHLLFGYE